MSIPEVATFVAGSDSNLSEFVFPEDEKGAPAGVRFYPWYMICPDFSEAEMKTNTTKPYEVKVKDLTCVVKIRAYEKVRKIAVWGKKGEYKEENRHHLAFIRSDGSCIYMFSPKRDKIVEILKATKGVMNDVEIDYYGQKGVLNKTAAPAPKAETPKA